MKEQALTISTAMQTEESKMTKRKYKISYKIKDKSTGKYKGLSNNMPSNETVEADSEANAIAKLKQTISFKIRSATEDWEIISVTAN